METARFLGAFCTHFRLSLDVTIIHLLPSFFAFSLAMGRCAVRSALEKHEDTDEDEEDEDEWELPPKRVRANMRMLLGEAPKTLCLHFPRRHQR